MPAIGFDVPGRFRFFDTLHHKAALISADVAKQLSWDPYLFTGNCEQQRLRRGTQRAGTCKGPAGGVRSCIRLFLAAGEIRTYPNFPP
jgi:hypothetical protein